MRNLREEQNWLTTVALLALAAIAVALALVYTRRVMIPFVLAVFVSQLVSPWMDWLETRLRFSRFAAVLATLLVVVAILLLLVLLLITSTSALISTAGTYSEQFNQWTHNTLAAVRKLGVDVVEDPEPKAPPQAGVSEEEASRLAARNRLWKGLQRFDVMGVVTGAAATAVDLLASGVLVLVFATYLLAGRRPPAERSALYIEIDTKVRRYLFTKFATSAVTGLLVWGILALFGLDMSYVFGMMAFLLNFIPSIGSMIATLLPLPIALAQFDSRWMAFGVVAVPGALQLAVGNAVEPKLMGKELQLHPVTILLALLFWGLLWGIAGMLLAVPLTAVLRIVLMRLEMTRPLGELLDGRLPGETTEAISPQ